MELVFDIINIITALVTLASVIAKVTPTQKDDAFIAKIMPIIEALALTPKK